MYFPSSPCFTVPDGGSQTGITYIAQVLKRNRTLKVLNLSENKLDVQGLVAIAEALVSNSCWFRLAPLISTITEIQFIFGDPRSQ